MKTYLFVALGASFGAVLRFLVKNIHIWDNATNFPADTFCINLAGSFLLAFFLRLAFEALTVGPNTRHAVSTGVLGAFTTFSAFCAETVFLITGGQLLTALMYASFSVLGGLALAYLGYILGQIVYPKRDSTPAQTAPAQILLKGETK